MVVIHRAHGFRFVIYTSDHEPVHIHITGSGQAKINLTGPDGKPEPVSVSGIKRSDMRRLMSEVTDCRERFLEEWKSIHASLTDEQLEAAEARGQTMLETEPRAVIARYNCKTGQVTVELLNGCNYVFPACLVQDLHDANPDDLADIKVEGLGFNLHWPKLDVDLYVPTLVAGVFGTRDWMRKAQADHATYTVKSATTRTNVAKGGRPRKRSASK